MAIEAVSRRTEPMLASGGQVLLPFPFRVLAARDLAVQLERNEHLYRLILGWDYTVEGVGADAGGHIRLVVPAVDGDKYVIEGLRPLERATDLQQQKVLDARFLNDELDSLQVQIMELRRDMMGVVSRLPADLLLPPINLPEPDPHDLWLKKLITGGRQLKGSAGQIADDAQAWAEQTAEASLRDLYETIDEGNVARDEAEAVATRIEMLAAEVGDALAAVQQEAQARATAIAALSELLTLTVARLDGNEAAVAVVQGAVADLEGLKAYYGVKLLAGGRIGFFKMDGSPEEVTATFGVDKLTVLPASGPVVQPFVMGFIDGQATLVLNNLVADGAIVANRIDVDALSAMSANLGEVTAGLVRNGTGVLRFDLPAMRLYRTDNLADIDLGNRRIRMST